MEEEKIVIAIDENKDIFIRDLQTDEKVTLSYPDPTDRFNELSDVILEKLFSTQDLIKMIKKDNFLYK